MPIAKRLTPAERLESRMGEAWQRILLVPFIRSMSRGIEHVDTSPEGIAAMVAQFHDARWISKTSNNVKIFMYACGLVARRADVSGFLSEEQMTQLAKHMNALSTIDKIDAMENVGFAFRQVFIWDLKAFRDNYRTPGSFKLPELPKPVKKLRPKLARHRK